MDEREAEHLAVTAWKNSSHHLEWSMILRAFLIISQLLVFSTLLSAAEKPIEKLKTASFVIGYVFRDGDESDRRPADAVIPVGGVLNGDDSIDVAALASRTIRQKGLNSEQIQTLLHATFEKPEVLDSKKYSRRECYEPHHIFVFYNRLGNPIGAIEICFLCLHVKHSPGYRTENGGSYEPADVVALQELCKQLGIYGGSPPAKPKE